jgi:hypothetical protein
VNPRPVNPTPPPRFANTRKSGVPPWGVVPDYRSAPVLGATVIDHRPAGVLLGMVLAIAFGFV